MHGDRLPQRVRADGPEGPGSSAPARSAVEREGALALAVGSALVGATASRIVFPHAALSAFIIAAMLAVLGLAAGARPKNRDDGGLEWLALFGTLVSVPAGVALARPSGVCLALLLAPPAGLALAAFWWSLLAPLRELASLRTHEDDELARQLAGRWLALIGSVSAPIALLASDVWVATAALMVALFGCAEATLASHARRRRWHWLSLVQRGAALPWRIVAIREFPPARLAHLAPLVRSDRPHDGVLIEAIGNGPYREGGPGIPRALVPIAAPTFPRAWFFFSDALRAAAAIVGALLAPLVSLTFSAVTARMLATHGVGSPVGANLLCGWLLLLSGPATGVALLFLAHIHEPTRGTVWWLGISIYLLAAPVVCFLLSFSSRLLLC